MTDERPAMYHAEAGWFHLLTAPADYEEEATFYFAEILNALGRKPRSWLELGSGGGNNASHYKRWVEGEVVLSDRSAEMIALSRGINPELEHIQGDMLTVDIGRQFDVVFVHDAAAYLTTVEQARQLAANCFRHCAAGGLAMICPDHTAENIVFETDHGGHDGDGRAMRYLEWMTPGPPGTFEYVVDYAYVYHEDGKSPRVALDRHTCGALPRQAWLDALIEAGFTTALGKPLVHSEVPEGSSEIFIGVR
jgi:SAM-dependent methyltransferase